MNSVLAAPFSLTNPEDLLQKSQSLSQKRSWLKLMHYQPNWLGGYESTVTSQNYFLNDKGKISPQNELKSLINYFSQPHANDENTLQCRFPARALWLQQNLPELAEQIDLSACTQFNQWRQKHPLDSISLVFASGYLDNPASLYGHVLLKLDSDIKNKQLLNPSFNFGADMTASDPALIYILKGIFGGYTSTYSYAEFYKNNHLYGEIELRDLWRYPLKLNPKQIALIQAHAWELQGIEFRYFFFKENCAFQMAEIIELVTDEDIISHQLPWVIPQNVFDGLRDQNLVETPQLIPSRQQRFYKRYEFLSAQEQTFLKNIVATSDLSQRTAYLNQTLNTLSATRQHALINALLDYESYLYVQHRDKKQYESQKLPLLKAQFLLPPTPSETLKFDSHPPTDAQKPSLLQMGWVANDQAPNALELRLRPAYFDTLNLAYAREPYSALSMFDSRLRLDPSGVVLQSIDFLKLQTLNLSRTGLAEEGGKAWKIRLGIEPENLKNKEKLQGFIEGGFGKGMAVHNLGAIFARMDARFEAGNTELNAMHFSALPTLGWISQPNAPIAVELNYAKKIWLASQHNPEDIFMAELRLGKSPHIDMRLSYQIHQADEFKVLLGYYW